MLHLRHHQLMLLLKKLKDYLKLQDYLLQKEQCHQLHHLRLLLEKMLP
tara:strand:+ start:456 stop:599 length:144 start_codon:yes stop_codon:yes gene_type:complete